MASLTTRYKDRLSTKPPGPPLRSPRPIMNDRSASRIGSLVLLISWATAVSGQEAGRSASPRPPSYPDHTRLLVVRDGDGREQPVGGRADWEVRRAHILAHFQDVAGPLPGGERRVPLDDAGRFDATGSGLHPQEAHVRHRAGRPRPGLAVDPRWRTEPTSRNTRPCSASTRPCPSARTSPSVSAANLTCVTRWSWPAAAMSRLAPDYPNFGEYKIDVYKHGICQCHDESDLEQPPRRRSLVQPG